MREMSSNGDPQIRQSPGKKTEKRARESDRTTEGPKIATVARLLLEKTHLRQVILYLNSLRREIHSGPDLFWYGNLTEGAVEACPRGAAAAVQYFQRFPNGCAPNRRLLFPVRYCGGTGAFRTGRDYAARQTNRRSRRQPPALQYPRRFQSGAGASLSLRSHEPAGDRARKRALQNPRRQDRTDHHALRHGRRARGRG